MKSLKKYILGVAALSIGVGFTACQDDFDDHKPGFVIPEATITPNTTILEAKQTFWQNTVNYIDTIRTKDDGSHYIIHGRVISSDRTGNIYKKLVIQDETAALAISVNSTGMYTKYAPGQEVVIDLTDMYIGKYNGTQQLGYPLFYEKNQVWEATFMPPVMLEAHMQLNGMPNTAELDTISMRNFSELPTDPSLLAGIQSQLVRFNNVSFVEGGKSAFTDGYKVTTNRLLTDANGQTLTVRTSGYATFRDVMLPEGNGDVVGILDYYSTSDDSDSNPWQLTLIDAQGCMNFGNPTIEPGGEDNPYTVEQAIAIEEAGRSAKGWTTGYIVGAVAPEVTSVTSNADIEWGAEVVLANTLVIGPTADCKDYNKCLVISLPQDTKLRELGNLRDNPSNFGKQIWLYGSLAKYMDTWGITDNSGATSQFRIEGVETGGSTVPDGDGQEATPYNVGQVIAFNPTSTTDAVQSGVWVAGYIVGYMPSNPSTTLSNTVFGAPADLKTNIVLGPTPDCTEYSKCITIQLPIGTVRDNLNLQDHANMLGAKVSLYGDVMKYCGGPGLKNTSKYNVLAGGEGGDTPVVPPVTGDGDGTQEKPYTTVNVIALNPTSTTEAPAGGAGVWVKGYIVGYMPSSPKTTLDNTVFAATADLKTNIVLGPTADCTDYTQCIGIQLPSGAVRAALNLQDNPGNLGAAVVLYGDVMKYCSGPGLKNTSKYELGEGGGGDTPTPSVDTIYEGLVANSDGWTFDNINMPDAASYIWSWKEYNGSGYLNASCYIGGTAYASEAIAYTTVDLTGKSEAELTFDHAAKFQTTLKDFCGLVVREAGASSWTSLSIPTWPEAGSWTFVNSGAISLKAYAGKKIEIGLKYGSSESGSDTWEIKNFIIKGK
ncbi:MAG: hypothetical protein K2L55_00225 [Muribaculaceae bacterium]|nr:hypothetical protein [Muribaculaceae bacterium]